MPSQRARGVNVKTTVPPWRLPCFCTLKKNNFLPKKANCELDGWTCGLHFHSIWGKQKQQINIVRLLLACFTKVNRGITYAVNWVNFLSPWHPPFHCNSAANWNATDNTLWCQDRAKTNHHHRRASKDFFNALEATPKINQLQQIAILGGQEFLKQQTRVHLAPHGGTEGQPTAAYRARQSWQKRHS